MTAQGGGRERRGRGGGGRGGQGRKLPAELNPVTQKLFRESENSGGFSAMTKFKPGVDDKHQREK